MKHTPIPNAPGDEQPADANERRVLSRKELAKENRHALYQRAKLQRATDPRYLAMKQALKERQREAYQKVKAQRKAVTADAKTKQKAERSAANAARRKQVDQELMKLVSWVRDRSAAQND